MTAQSKRALLLWSALIVFGVIIQFASLRSNPPGFFIDESSIAFNAYSIATTGRDEHGESWPLFFRAFGEYKNPVYVYVVAAVFRVFGPGIVTARVIGCLAALVTALLLGLLATRITQKHTAGLILAVLALLTPWLFELSRLAMEVTIYPLVVVLFLMSVWSASRKEQWSIANIATISLCLALLTYTYSIGRLLAPLLALGLLLFATRKHLSSIFFTWIVFAITLIPLLVYRQKHPEALTGRFHAITYIYPESRPFQVARKFLGHFFTNLDPWKMFVSDSSKVNELLHIAGQPAMLTITAVLVIAGIILLLRLRKLDSWWRFVIYGLFASSVPASLTIDNFHMLRLAPVPVFLLVLCIPAVEWLLVSRYSRILLLVVAAITIQGAWFQIQFHRSINAPQRRHNFDADYERRIFDRALSVAGTNPIFIADNSAVPGYIQAYWYAVLKGIPLSKFVNLGFEKSPPANVVVISTEPGCVQCRVLDQSEPYTLYETTGEAPVLSELKPEDMKAEVKIEPLPAQLQAGAAININVSLKNISQVTWFSGSRGSSPFRVCVGNHWLSADGQVFQNDDGRGCLVKDLLPGESASIVFRVNAPRRTGEYILEIDALQEGVRWFGKQTATRTSILVVD